MRERQIDGGDVYELCVFQENAKEFYSVIESNPRLRIMTSLY